MTAITATTISDKFNDLLYFFQTRCAAQKQVLNTQDMQEYLGIGRNKLFRLFQDPGFPAYRIGKDGPWLIRRRDLEKWLEELIRQPTKTHVFR